MTEEKRHAQLKYPKWETETLIAIAIGEETYAAMPEVKYIRLEAQIALGIKALDQQPKQLDPVSFQAAMVANNMIVSAAFKESMKGAKLRDIPPGMERATPHFRVKEARKLEAFGEQSSRYLEGVEINFGPQLGQRR